MLSQPLLDYLQKAKEHGLSIIQIEESLKGQGWDIQIIQKAKEFYESNENIPKTPIAPSLQPLGQGKDYSTPESKSFVFANNFKESSAQDNNSGSSFFSGKKVVLGVFAVLLSLIILFLTTVVLVAYGAVKIGDTNLRRSISNIVLSVPFMPKTPEYVLAASAKVQEEVKQMTIDGSFAINSQSLTQAFGVGNFDVSIKGPIDYSDPQNPSLSLTIAMAKDFDLDIRLKDKKTYFRINQIPTFLKAYTALIGIPEETLQKFSQKWFLYTSKSLETEARQNLDDKQNSLTVEEMERLNNALYNDKVLKNLSMTQENIDGKRAYKIRLNANSEVINIIEKALKKDTNKEVPTEIPGMKASDYIKNMIVDQWVDTNNYYVYKIAINFEIKYPETNAFLMPSQGDLYETPKAPTEEIPVSLVIKFSDYGKEAIIEIPADAQDFEEYLKTNLELPEEKNLQKF